MTVVSQGVAVSISPLLWQQTRHWLSWSWTTMNWETLAWSCSAKDWWVQVVNFRYSGKFCTMELFTYLAEVAVDSSPLIKTLNTLQWHLNLRIYPKRGVNCPSDSSFAIDDLLSLTYKVMGKIRMACPGFPWSRDCNLHINSTIQPPATLWHAAAP